MLLLTISLINSGGGTLVNKMVPDSRTDHTVVVRLGMLGVMLHGTVLLSAVAEAIDGPLHAPEPKQPVSS